MPKPLIGAHVSAAGGVHNAIANGEALGVEAIQIFGSSPQQWFTRMPTPEQAGEFRSRRKKSAIQAVYLHGSYLVNLATPTPENLAKSIKSLAEHLRIAEMIGADGLIFHTGSKGDSDHHDAIKQVAKGMKEVLKAVPGDAKLMLENSAGGGNKIGNVSKDIGEILELVKSPRAAACLDTAHAFEAGQIEAYTPSLLKKFLDELEKEIGLKNILVLHTNDSKSKFDSHHDRH